MQAHISSLMYQHWKMKQSKGVKGHKQMNKVENKSITAEEYSILIGTHTSKRWIVDAQAFLYSMFLIVISLGLLLHFSLQYKLAPPLYHQRLLNDNKLQDFQILKPP